MNPTMMWTNKANSGLTKSLGLVEVNFGAIQCICEWQVDQSPLLEQEAD